MADKHTPTVLTIAGFDPYGGAGIQADIKTIHALGGYALSVVAAITAQNSKGVASVEVVNAKILRSQLRTLLDDVQVDAVKIGMLGNTDIVKAVIDMIKQYNLKKIVLDPVLASTSGKELLEEDGIDLLKNELFPLSELITPNLPEANKLLKTNYAGQKGSMLEAIDHLRQFGAKGILLKGGHSSQKEAIDYLWHQGNIHTFTSPRLHTKHTHGTGCILSSGIASLIAQGIGLPEAIKLSKKFLYSQMMDASHKINLKHIRIDKQSKMSII